MGNLQCNGKRDSDHEQVSVILTEKSCKTNYTKKNKKLHTSQLWEEGTISSSFFPLKISIATK
jgi:hypothetical protein